MPTTYTAAEPEVNELLAQVMQRHHKPLHEAGVRVGIVMASELKAGGYPAYATIRIVSLKDRLSKQYDAELVIDAHEWESLRERHRRALLDHELSHLQLAKARMTGEHSEITKGGIVFERDDLGRPKLKTAKGDWNGSDGFKDVVARNGNWSIEFLNAKRCHIYATAARDGTTPETQRLIDTIQDLKDDGITISVNQSTFTPPEGEPH
jgi:Putative phage metallopeptidase